MKLQLTRLISLIALTTLLAACSSAVAPAKTSLVPQAAAPQGEVAGANIINQPVAAQPAALTLVQTEVTEAAARRAPAAQTDDDPAKYGLLAGNIEDAGFNQLAWEGLQQAGQELGIEPIHSDTTDSSNYSDNVNNLLSEGVDAIVAVGFDFAPAVRLTAQTNPNLAFINVDFPSQAANDLGLLFSTDEPAFMAGYLAAGMSQSGTVCTYGGRATPPVLIFMVGFEQGVLHYNNQNNANVQVLGWQTDPSINIGGQGTFVDSFTDRQAGRQAAEALFDQGCDILMPVAGATGLGAAAAAQERGLTLIGVDADQARTNPDNGGVYLTSVQKHIETTVLEAVRTVESGELADNPSLRKNYIGTLANGGVGLAPFYDYEDQIPQPLKDELTAITQQLSDGSLSTGWPINSSAGIAAAPQAQAGTESEMQTMVAPVEAPAPAQAISLGLLRNMTYQSEFTVDGTTPLSNGEYREPAAPGSASEVVVTLTNNLALGDLTGDGASEAAVILTTSGGGSGTFYQVAIVTSENGVPTNIANAFLGDRIEVTGLTIRDGQVIVDLLERGPNDAMADPPTQPVTKQFGLQYQLVDQAAE